MRRLLRHVLALPGAVARAFPADALARIEQAIRESEKLHDGEIRFAVEAALDPTELWRGVSARQRAIAVFSELGVWDTERNNGVLIYLLLADRDVEIVADRGIAARVKPEEWNHICSHMESALAAGHYANAVIQGIGEIGRLLATHFPARGEPVNALSDRPVLVR